MTVIQTLEKIVNIKSVSREEDELADYVENELKQVENLEIYRVNNNVIAKLKGESEKTIVLAGHLDTVPISQITNNFPSHREKIDGDEYIFGRGTVDMKPGVAIMIELAKNLKNPKNSVTFVFYEREEVNADENGLGFLVENRPELLKADAAIILEPTNCQVEAGCNGTLRFDLILKGVAAHSARSFMGENAIHKAQNALEILNRWNEENHEELLDGLCYREGLNAVLISGGTATNVIPDSCTIHINHRFAPNKTASEAVENMRKLFDGFEIEMKDVSNGAKPGMQSGFCKEFADFASHQIGAKVNAKLGWTDVARFSALAVPAINFAPGNPNLCHHDEERVKTKDVEICYNLLESFLR